MVDSKNQINKDHPRIKNRLPEEQARRDKLAANLKEVLKSGDENEHENEDYKEYYKERKERVMRGIESYKKEKYSQEKRRESFLQGIEQDSKTPEKLIPTKERQLLLLKNSKIEEAYKLGELMGTGWLVEKEIRERIGLDIFFNKRFNWGESSWSSTDIVTKCASLASMLGLNPMGDMDFAQKVINYRIKNKEINEVRSLLFYFGKGRFSNYIGIGENLPEVDYAAGAGLKVDISVLKKYNLYNKYNISNFSEIPEEGDVILVGANGGCGRWIYQSEDKFKNKAKGLDYPLFRLGE